MAEDERPMLERRPVEGRPPLPFGYLVIDSPLTVASVL